MNDKIPLQDVDVARGAGLFTPLPITWVSVGRDCYSPQRVRIRRSLLNLTEIRPVLAEIIRTAELDSRKEGRVDG